MIAVDERNVALRNRDTLAAAIGQYSDPRAAAARAAQARADEARRDRLARQDARISTCPVTDDWHFDGACAACTPTTIGRTHP